VSAENDPYTLSDAEKARLLGRLALAWDGQWFLKAYEECGWEIAARLNARVRRAFGRIEMAFLLRALGKRRAENVADAARVLQTYYGGVLAEGFRGEFQVEESAVYVTVTECAALAGSKRAGLDRHDQACIGCPELFRAYFEKLLPGHDVEVETLGQMGYGAERCRYVVRVS
jgi:hypothetical protein